jgi:putative transposase
MIDPTHPLPIVRQAQLLDVSRSSVYYAPQPTSDADLALMRRIDELHLDHPFAGSRMLRDLLNREGFEVGRKHVTTLMRKMGVEALYQKPRTSGRDCEHCVFPYLLRGMTIGRPNQVWAMDTTYIPMRRGFVYLTAVVDWASRRVLAFRLSISLAADAAVDALKEAIARYGTPEIMNTDQGIHGIDVYRRAARARHSHQHGWQGLLARQRIRGTAVEVRQVRACLPACLRERLRSEDENRGVL